MEDRLNQIAGRLRQVERELADPAVYSDQQRLKNLSREQKELWWKSLLLYSRRSKPSQRHGRCCRTRS